MSVILAVLLAAAAPTAAPAARAAAQSRPSYDKPVPAGKLSTASPRSIVALMQKDGYRAKLVTDEGKRPYIESATAGATFYIHLQNCKETADCQDVMFRSSYDRDEDSPVKVEKINEFNRDNRWARAYLDKDSGPVIEYDVLFTDQLIDEKMFREALEIWDSVLTDFHKVINW
jgi:hypothetical protein